MYSVRYCSLQSHEGVAYPGQKGQGAEDNDTHVSMTRNSLHNTTSNSRWGDSGHGMVLGTVPVNDYHNMLVWFEIYTVAVAFTFTSIVTATATATATISLLLLLLLL